MFVYKVISKNHYSPETGAYISFGISAHDPEHGQTCFVPDVFIDESEARAFTERLNTLQVSPIHLIDVIEDALGVYHAAYIKMPSSEASERIACTMRMYSVVTSYRSSVISSS